MSVDEAFITSHDDPKTAPRETPLGALGFLYFIYLEAPRFHIKNII